MIITILDWMLALIVLIFGIRFSYTDLKDNRIYNKDLILFLIVALVVIIIQESFFFITFGHLYILFKHLIRGLFGICIGFLFWIIGLWAPADGKLFGVLSFVIPGRFLIVTSNSETLSLLSNILVIISIAVIIPNLTKLKKEDYKRIKNVLKPQSIGFSLLGVFGLLWILRMIMSILKINGNIIFTALILTLIMSLFKVLFKLKFKTVLIILFFARLFFDYPNYLTKIEVLNMIKVFVVYILLRMIIIEGIFNKNTFKKKVDDLKVGDYLAIIPVKEKGKLDFRRVNFFSLYNYISTALRLEDYKIVGDYDNAVGLEPDNIELIKKLFKEKKMNEVPVFKTMPFAPYIVLGFLIAIICKGDGFLLLGILIKTTLWRIGLLTI